MFDYSMRAFSPKGGHTGLGWNSVAVEIDVIELVSCYQNSLVAVVIDPLALAYP